MEKDNPPRPEDRAEDILIVEDSRTMASLLALSAKKEFGIIPTICGNYQEAEALLAERPQRFFAALLDLHLPDAPDGEIVDLIVGKGIPAIVFTGELSDNLRNTIWSKHIVDYVLKDNRDNIQQVMSIAKRLRTSKDVTILVADDSPMSRNLLRSLLEVWRFNVLEAADGITALRTIQDRGDVDMLITDFNMPGMDGIALVQEVRKTYSKSRLPIIGISGVGGATTSAYFIKAGANDYMHKPFLAEELYCRVISNLETMEYIATIRRLAECDGLTGIHNRRSFFAIGEKLCSEAQCAGTGLVAAMMDIDHFKDVNDTHGHGAGDEVIRFVADTLSGRFQGNGLVARIGGEEFCVLCTDLAPDKVEETFEALRRSIEGSVVKVDGREIRVTVSIGVCAKTAENLEGMLKIADKKLYEAKGSGRNRVMSAF